MKTNPDWKRLPKWEISLYLMFGIGSIVIICHHVFLASAEYYHILNQDDFVSGWTVLSYRKDISNYEWTFWYNYFWNVIPWLCGHIVLGGVLQFFSLRRYRKPVFLCFSMTSLTYMLGVKIVVFYVLHASIAYVASLSKSRCVVWVTSLSLLTTLNLEFFNTNGMVYIYDAIDDYEGLKYYLFVFCLALVILRYISFNLEKCVSKSHHGYLDLLFYIFYLPLFFTGPVLTYDLFLKQISMHFKPWSTARIKETLKNLFRVIMWGVFNEFIIHILYFDAIHRQPHLLNTISLWTVIGIAYCQGQFFMTKYVVLYELPGEIAKIDGLDPPAGPKCVSYVYRYSDMWKCFDRGFYNFLKTYIYIAIGGSKHGVIWQLTGSLMCFMFIFVWHGAELYLLLWCLLNFLGCTIEVFGDWLVHTNGARKYLDKLGLRNTRRLNAIASVPLYLMSSMGIFVFFGGSEVGAIFFNRILVDISWPALMLFILLLYCNIQNAMLVQDWQNRNKLKRS